MGSLASQEKKSRGEMGYQNEHQEEVKPGLTMKPGET